MTAAKSLNGRRLQQSNGNDALLANGIPITQPCADASIIVAAENTGANTRAIAIQLKDANGNDINYVAAVDVFVVSGANGLTGAATGGSSGLSAGTDGAIIATPEAKKHFVVTSEADGDIDLVWTDTGTESVAIGIRLPTGRIVMSDAFANAN